MKAAAASGGGREPIPEGIYKARCVTVAGLGMLENPFEEGKLRAEMVLTFELPDHRVSMKDKEGTPIEGPAHLSQTCTISLHEKSRLRPIVKALMGRDITPEEEAGFDLEQLLGKPCQVILEHYTKRDGTTGERFQGFLKLSNEEAKPAESPLVYFDAWNPDPKALRELPDWLRNKVKLQADVQEEEEDDQIDLTPVSEETEKVPDDSGEVIPF